MTNLEINLEALTYNANKVKQIYNIKKIKILPVLKEIANFSPICKKLKDIGIKQFGFSAIDELNYHNIYSTTTTPKNNVLIQLSPPSRSKEVVTKFSRSHQSVLETLEALDQAASSFGLTHEIMLMINLGDHREGLEPEELQFILEQAYRLKNLEIKGFGVTMSCLKFHFPNDLTISLLSNIRQIFINHSYTEPEISVGGSVFHNFLFNKKECWPITEVRMGDPFLVGYDIYRGQELSGGTFRKDVITISAEVLEIRTRFLPQKDLETNNTMSQEKFISPRINALVDIGRFQIGSGTIPVANQINSFICLWPGAFITGISAGYTVIDITDCSTKPIIGQTIHFAPGYWVVAHASRNQHVKIVVK